MSVTRAEIGPSAACSDRQLWVSHIGRMSKEVYAAVDAWLSQHGVDAHEVLAESMIDRDPVAGTLGYDVGVGVDDRERHVRRRPEGLDPAVEWPAPFPQILLDLRPPAACPTCGHHLDGPTS